MKPIICDSEQLPSNLVAEWMRRASIGEAPEKIRGDKLLRRVRLEGEKMTALLSTLHIYPDQGGMVVSDGTNHQYLSRQATPWHQQIFWERESDSQTCASLTTQ